MPWILLALSALLLTGSIFFFLRQKDLHRRMSQESQALQGPWLMLQQGLESLREQVNSNLQGSSQLLHRQLSELQNQIHQRLYDSAQLMSHGQQHIGERLDRAAQVVGDLQGQLGKLETANAHLLEVGRDIRGLQEILKTPKLRGSLGEFLLADLLAQILPREHFQLQYGFNNNEKVDAVIRLGEGLVSIDAKFPLENFQRFSSAQDEAQQRHYKRLFLSDVRKHIDSIARKYIRPAEGTYDFALMYIPAENIYYEIIVKDEWGDGDRALTDRAMGQRVIPVSPNTLYLYLNTIVLGLKGLRIEKRAQEILSGLSRLRQEIQRIQESFRKTGSHFHHAHQSFEEAERRLGQLDHRIEQLHHADSADELVSNFQEEEKIHALS